MECPCDLPDSGQPVYQCARLGCRMTPHYCNLYLTQDNYRAAWDGGRGPGQEIPARPKPTPSGPGTELKLILKKFGIRAKGCGCTSRAAEMDRRGPEWCRENIDRIVGWLRGQARKRKLPFSRSAAKILVRLAIRNSERRQN